MDHFRKLYSDNLNKLKEELSLYKNESDIWKLEGSITNTPGNLCLHICGNLNHFIGALLSKTGYIRERDLEFSKKNISRDELLKEVDGTIKMMNNFFDGHSENDLEKRYPDNKFGEDGRIGFVLARLISHLTYHLGQINYHRRINFS